MHGSFAANSGIKGRGEWPYERSLGRAYKRTLLIENNINVHFKHIAIDDEFVKQASVCRQLEHYNLDTNSIIKEVNNG